MGRRSKLSRHSPQLKKNSQELKSPKDTAKDTGSVTQKWDCTALEEREGRRRRSKHLFILSSMTAKWGESCALCRGSTDDVHSTPKQREAGERGLNQEVISSSKR